MVILEKDGAVKTLTNEALIEMLKAQGWVVKGSESDIIENEKPKRGRKAKES